MTALFFWGVRISYRGFVRFHLGAEVAVVPQIECEVPAEEGTHNNRFPWPKTILSFLGYSYIVRSMGSVQIINEDAEP